MKRAIEWLDEFYASGAGERMKISELLDLVLAVRSETMDAAELLVRKQTTKQNDPNVRSFLEALAEDIALMGRKSR